MLLTAQPEGIIAAAGSEAPPSVPVNTDLPEITGTLLVGETLTCSTGTWTNSPTNHAYQWKLDGADVGTDQDTYLTTAEGSVTCAVTASNAAGNGTPATSAAVVVTEGTTATLTGFYPWTDLTGHISSATSYSVTDYHSQTSRLPQSLTGVPEYTTRDIRLHYRVPNGVLTGSNAYIEGIMPDSLAWGDYYPTGANQAHIFLRDGHGVTIGGLVMDGGWDGVRCSSARGTTVQDCAFIKLRDDVIEYDSSLNDSPTTHTFRRNLCIGWLQCISSRPGEEPGGTPIAPLPGNQIIMQDDIFVSQQWFNGSEWRPGLFLKRRNDSNGDPLPHTLTDCVVAYDLAPNQGEPESNVAVVGDTVTTCTFVWLGAGTVPAKFGLGNHPGGWTVINGTGAQDHLGVTGTSALDWLENYIVAWLNAGGTARTNLLDTVKAKVDFDTVLSGSDRHVMLPGLQAKLSGGVLAPVVYSGEALSYGGEAAEYV